MCRVVLAVYLVYSSYLTLFSLCSYYKKKISINTHSLTCFFSDEKHLIIILPKNQAAPIEMVISDFFRILKTFIAFVSLCHKSPKAKRKL